MADFVPASLVGGGIYHQVQNRETRPTVVSVVGVVAGIGRANVAPRLGFPPCEPPVVAAVTGWASVLVAVR